MEKQTQDQISFKELEEAATPLVELLRKKGHPHMTALVTDRSVVLTEDIMGVPLDYED